MLRRATFLFHPIQIPPMTRMKKQKTNQKKKKAGTAAVEACDQEQASFGSSEEWSGGCKP
jgi:hypothetical protein